MSRYNHLYTIAFSVMSNDPDADDVTPDMLRAALWARIRQLDSDHTLSACEWFEACNNERDSYEMDDNPGE